MIETTAELFAVVHGPTGIYCRFDGGSQGLNVCFPGCLPSGSQGRPVGTAKELATRVADYLCGSEEQHRSAGEWVSYPSHYYPFVADEEGDYELRIDGQVAVRLAKPSRSL